MLPQTQDTDQSLYRRPQHIRCHQRPPCPSESLRQSLPIQCVFSTVRRLRYSPSARSTSFFLGLDQTHDPTFGRPIQCLCPTRACARQSTHLCLNQDHFQRGSYPALLPRNMPCSTHLWPATDRTKYVGHRRDQRLTPRHWSAMPARSSSLRYPHRVGCALHRW